MAGGRAGGMLLLALLARSGASGPVRLHVGAAAADDGRNHTWFRSLHAARDAIRRLGAAEKAAGVLVTVESGTYQPLELTAADSGRAGAEIVWEGLPGAIISAATDIPRSAFKPWPERPGVLTADLHSLGVKHYGNLSTSDSGTGNLGCTHDRVGLYFQREAMVLARFPNIEPDGVWKYSWVDQPGIGGHFGVSPMEPAASRLPLWTKEPNPWLHGYWFYSWADGYTPLLAATTTENGLVNVTVAGISRENGAAVKAGARFYGVNLLCELDSPSEYYIDDRTGLLYFYPPHGSGPPSQWAPGTVAIATNETAVNLTGVRHVTLRDLTITGSVHTGIEGSDVESVLIENCSVSGHGRHGIDLQGVSSGVADSVIYSVGGSGMRIQGGVAMTLEAGNMFARANHVHHIGKRTYQPALFWGGVNNTYSHNLLEDGPAMCIWGGGNVADGVACTFDGNRVNRCVTETCDQVRASNVVILSVTFNLPEGPASVTFSYTASGMCQGSFHTCGQSGQAFINRGNAMKNGHFTDIRPGQGVIHPPRGLPAICAPMTVGFYMDDEMSGWLVENNTFTNCQTAMLLGGGRDARIVSNRVESCDTGVEYDNRGMNWELKTNCPLAIAGLNKTLLGPAGHVYAERWPEMVAMARHATCVPTNDTIAHNVYSNTTKWCSASAASVASWGSRLINNTDLSPPSPPPPPLPQCKPNATRSGRPYRECTFIVTIGAHDKGHDWGTQNKLVKADWGECFRMDGCGVWGAVGRQCEVQYKDKAQLLVTRNGTIVGEGHCCVPSVKDYVVSWQRGTCAPASGA